jgi:plastocyanin
VIDHRSVSRRRIRVRPALVLLLGLAMATSVVAGTGPMTEITLVQGSGPDLLKPRVSRSQGARIRWCNHDTRGHTITFTDWPFAEPPEPIRIAAGEKSHWYTVYYEQAKVAYEYAIDPPVKTQKEASSSGPPDVPEIVVDE